MNIKNRSIRVIISCVQFRYGFFSMCLNLREDYSLITLAVYILIKSFCFRGVKIFAAEITLV